MTKNRQKAKMTILPKMTTRPNFGTFKFVLACKAPQNYRPQLYGPTPMGPTHLRAVFLALFVPPHCGTGAHEGSAGRATKLFLAALSRQLVG